MYLTPCRYSLGAKGILEQEEVPPQDALALLTLMNSLTQTFTSAAKFPPASAFIIFTNCRFPKLSAAQKKKLADAAGKLLKNPRDVKERAALEAFIARELYGLSLDDWKHLTGTFTFGSGETKAELDEIIRQSVAAYG